MEEQQFVLNCLDGRMAVDDCLIGQCTTLKNIKDDLDEGHREIPMKNITLETLETIIFFLDHHQRIDQEPDLEKNPLDEWDVKFLDECKSIKGKISTMANAVDYLNYDLMMNVIGKYVADVVRNTNPEDIESLLEL